MPGSLFPCLDCSKKQLHECAQKYWDTNTAHVENPGGNTKFSSKTLMHVEVQTWDDRAKGQHYSKENMDLEGKMQPYSRRLRLFSWDLNMKHLDCTFIHCQFSSFAILLFKPLLIWRCCPWWSYLLDTLGNDFVQIMLHFILKAKEL